MREAPQVLSLQANDFHQIDNPFLQIFAGEDFIDNNRIPLDTDKSKMIFYSNFLFIVPAEGKLVVMETSSGKNRYKTYPIPPHINSEKGNLIIKNDSLFYGYEGKGLEIKVEGTKVLDVKIKEKK